MEDLDRRALLLGAGVGAGLLAASPDIASAASAQARSLTIKNEVAAPGPALKPTHTVDFAVIGLDHYHIMGMTAAVKRGGGRLVAVYATDPKQIADFRRLFGDVPLARSEAEILENPSIKLVCGAPIPDQRAPLGIRVMRHGKDFLSDKPAITSLEQLAEVRKAIRETGRKFAIMYSELLEVRAAVKAGELIRAGAIGKVVQTVNLAPHKANDISRPDWFWDVSRYGGILTDIGSHQADQFLYYTNSKTAKVVSAQVANVAHPNRPKFQDFGDMTFAGDGGFGYVRVDWFTPEGLGVWGDGRLFVLGTEGYIELRKYADPAGRPGGDHLILVDNKQQLHLDCSQVILPFGPQFVADLVERTSVAQDQEQALLAAELVLTAQKLATTRA